MICWPQHVQMLGKMFGGVHLTHILAPAGLLSSGLIPAVSHAMHNLMTSDAIVLPASATVFVQARISGLGGTNQCQNSTIGMPLNSRDEAASYRGGRDINLNRYICPQPFYPHTFCACNKVLCSENVVVLTRNL